MSGKRRKPPRQKDLTAELLSESFDTDRIDRRQRFGQRGRDAQQNKILRTALLRAADEQAAGDVESLPVGQVLQVYSLYCEVENAEGRTLLCVVRKTMKKVQGSAPVVGDRVRYRETGGVDELGRPEAVIEAILDRSTLLTRADSFNPRQQDPIVANAEQMLIVVSLRQPAVRWGLVDRMIVAARAGKLLPIVCLNKIDLDRPLEAHEEEEVAADEALNHYQSLGLRCLRTSAVQGVGLEELRELLKDRTTVLAGHSGVGKSSLIRAIQPHLDLRVAPVSDYTDKGRHTTTSARRYKLTFSGFVIDTPGVKLFGLWNVDAESLIDYFPDVADETAPDWRVRSYQRILESLGE